MFITNRFQKVINQMSRHVKTSKDDNNKTLPIKDVRQQKEMLRYWLVKRDKSTGFKKFLADRNYMFILLGINTAFRCEDLLQLRPIDLNGGWVRIKENKTGKTQNFRMNSKLYKEVEAYCNRNNITSNEYLFKSRNSNGIIGCITRQQALNMIKQTGNAVGIKYKFGVHSLRKTFGYNYITNYGTGAELVTLMKMYNHTSPTTTLLYVMWDSNETEKARADIFNGITSL